MFTQLAPIYADILRYLYDSTPLYRHRDSAQIKKMDLQKITALCRGLGDPHRQFKAVHVAGTNGKTSTTHALGTILQAAGYRVGMYTSPHIRDFTERIRINGMPVDKGYVVDFVRKHQGLFEAYRASFFEMSVAIAYSFFADQQVDIAVVEVGLGGRLDATNIIDPMVSVITNISRDHTAVLGSTLAEIAQEKAGIIKPCTPVVIGEYSEDTLPVFDCVAQEKKAPLYLACDEYKVQLLEHRPSELVLEVHRGHRLWDARLLLEAGGGYQCKNIPAVLVTMDLLNEGGLRVDKGSIRRGLAQLQKSTGLMGRWQVVASRPRIIVDVAHNDAGIAELCEQLAYLVYEKLHVVIGMKKKPLDEALAMLRFLPKEARYYGVKADNHRSMKGAKLMELMGAVGLQGYMYPSVDQGVEAAIGCAGERDLILVTGSCYVVAEVLACR